MNKQLLSQRDLAKHVGKAFSTMSGYVEQFPQFFPHDGREGLKRRYFPQALEVATTISVLKAQRVSVPEITEILSGQFPMLPSGATESAAAAWLEPVIPSDRLLADTLSPAGALADVQSSIERSTERRARQLDNSSTAAFLEELHQLKARVTELENALQEVESRLRAADTEREDYHSALAADLLERDRLMVNWVKELHDSSPSPKRPPAAEGLWGRIVKGKV